MKLIAGTGADENAGKPLLCANCLTDFDHRGGVAFSGNGQQGRMGLCAECVPEAKERINEAPIWINGGKPSGGVG